MTLYNFDQLKEFVQIETYSFFISCYKRSYYFYSYFHHAKFIHNLKINSEHHNLKKKSKLLLKIIEKNNIIFELISSHDKNVKKNNQLSIMKIIFSVQ